MLSIYHLKMLPHFDSYENKCKVLPKGMAVQLPPKNRSIVKLLSLENVYLILSSYENKCKLIP